MGSRSTRGGAIPPPPPPLESGGFLLDALWLLLPLDVFGSVSDVDVDIPLVRVAEE